MQRETINFLRNDILGEFSTDYDLEFSMHSYTSRMLVGFNTYASLNPIPKHLLVSKKGMVVIAPIQTVKYGKVCTFARVSETWQGSRSPSPKPESAPCFVGFLLAACALFFLFFFFKIYNMLYFISNKDGESVYMRVSECIVCRRQIKVIEVQ